MPVRRRRPWASLTLVVAGLAAGVLVLEASLRLAAFVVQRWTASESPGRQGASARVLALGDSNTFGLYVGTGRAYPHELEARWNGQAGHRPIAVINAGYPGNNSSSIRRQLGDLLAANRPALVTIMIGGNDWWREPDPLDDASLGDCVRRATLPGASADVQRPREWRIVRALRLLTQWLPVPAGQLWRKLPPMRPEVDPAWPEALSDNLRMIAACVRRIGSRPVLLTYPSDFGPYGLANRTIRAVAAGEAIALIDLAHSLSERCPRSDCAFLFPAPDQHPTVAGHAWIAELLAAELATEFAPDALPAAPDAS